MRRKNKNQKLVIILMVLVALISVGYAQLVLIYKLMV